MSDGGWYAPLVVLESKGSRVDPVVRFMWQLTGLADAPSPTTSYGTEGHWHIFDGAFGSGRMFAFADPQLHALHGIEVDAAAAEQVISTATGAGFSLGLHIGSMVDYRLAEPASNSYAYGWSRTRARFHVGLINPPFSLHFDSPHVAKWPDIATFGKYGANSATTSQHLAVAQALAWCEVVAAVVPRSFAEAYVADDKYSRRRWHGDKARLRTVYHLPRSAFRDEGAEVETSSAAPTSSRV